MLPHFAMTGSTYPAGRELGFGLVSFSFASHLSWRLKDYMLE